MRESDWSSDVCSSDLPTPVVPPVTPPTTPEAPKGPALPETGDDASMAAMALGGILAAAGLGLAGKRKKED